MEYKAKNCSICGSGEIKLVSHKQNSENVFYTYRCMACGEVFSTETAFLRRHNRVVEKEEDLTLKNESSILSATEVYKKCREFVVEIMAGFGDTTSCGTGILLGNGYILSNAHVVAKRKYNRAISSDIVICKFSNDEKKDVDLIYVNINKDLAILYSEDIDNSGAIFDNNSVETGEKVYAIGNSKGEGICILDGIVSDKERIIGNERYIMYSAPTVSGNSGGPLFNEKGEIIGVVTLGRKDATAMNFAIPVKTIESFITEANKKKELEIILKH